MPLSSQDLRTAIAQGGVGGGQLPLFCPFCPKNISMFICSSMYIYIYIYVYIHFSFLRIYLHLFIYIHIYICVYMYKLNIANNVYYYTGI